MSRDLTRKKMPHHSLPGSRVMDHMLTLEEITAFLEYQKNKGCTSGTIAKYRYDLSSFYNALPEGKHIKQGTLYAWQKELQDAGYASRTVNSYISTVNNLLWFLGRGDLQFFRQLPVSDSNSPELSRSEYLRLLLEARTLGNRRTYLLVKVFACIGLAVRELQLLTVDAVAKGYVVKPENGTNYTVPIPNALRNELRDYIQKNHISEGPVFVSRTGKNLNRSIVSYSIQNLSGPAGVPSEKCNPRCLRKLYQTTVSKIEADVRRLVEQTHKELLDREQELIGWETPSDDPK